MQDLAGQTKVDSSVDQRASGVHPAGLVSRQVRGLALSLVLTLVLVPVVTNPPACAQTFTVLYSFKGYPNDGAGPWAGVVMDTSENLYGTTLYGGSTRCVYAQDLGCGTVFKLSRGGKESVLHSFRVSDGAVPTAGVILDSKGDLYGTTETGGREQDCQNGVSVGCGVVFKLSGNKFTVLYRFCSAGLNCSDGVNPRGSVVMDAGGALYGTTYLGGSLDYGVVFKLVGSKESVLHNFTGFPDGAYPEAGLVMDAQGNLYGTASSGGARTRACDGGCGTVFKLAGKELTVLHAFKETPDGDTPVAALLIGPHGDLYGTTVFGGNSYGLGTVFQVNSAGKERVLYRFGPPLHHAVFSPVAGVVRDAEGNLYGVTEEGGAYDAGLAFEITKDGKERVLHNFCRGSCDDGAYPTGDLTMDAKGNLYGTAYGGGAHNNGVVFRITP